MLKKLYTSAAVYTVFGLVAGLAYRELTRSHEFVGRTQLVFVHTHLLILGTTVFLVLLLLERAFRLSQERAFTAFFWVYHAGLIVTATMMAVKGSMQILGGPADAKAIAGISGTGHILLAVAFTLLFVVLKKRVWSSVEVATAPAEPVAAH